MAFTDDELQKIIDQVVEILKSNSVGVDDLETVSSLTGLTSLPARKGETVVLAPLSLLSKPAEDAAIKAITYR